MDKVLYHTGMRSDQREGKQPRRYFAYGVDRFHDLTIAYSSKPIDTRGSGLTPTNSKALLLRLIAAANEIHLYRLG